MDGSAGPKFLGQIDLYAVVHCKFSNPSLVWNGLRAAERLAICDLLVEPVAPVKVGSSVRVIEIESQPPAEGDSTDLWTTCRRWRVGPCVASGVVLGIRGYELDMVELLVSNDSRAAGVLSAGGGDADAVDNALVSVHYVEQSGTVHLCQKARMVRGLLRLFNLLPRSRTVQTMKMERFLEVLDGPVGVPSMAAVPCSADGLQASQFDVSTAVLSGTCSDSIRSMRLSSHPQTAPTFESCYGVPLPTRAAEAQFSNVWTCNYRTSRIGFNGSLVSVPEDGGSSHGSHCAGDAEDHCVSDDDSSTIRGVPVGGES